MKYGFLARKLSTTKAKVSDWFPYLKSYVHISKTHWILLKPLLDYLLFSLKQTGQSYAPLESSHAMVKGVVEN